MNRDYIIISLGACLTFLLGGILVPALRFLPNASMRAIAFSPLYSCILYLVLSRTNTKYATILFGAILGVLLTPFMPYLLPITVLSAVIAQIIPTNEGKAIMFPAPQFALMYLALFLLTGVTIPAILLGPLTLASLVLGSWGVFIGKQIEAKIIRGHLL
jgi:hypothetical protein